LQRGFHGACKSLVTRCFRSHYAESPYCIHYLRTSSEKWALMLGSLRLNDSLDEGQFWPWLHAHLSTFVGDRRVVIRANDAHSLFCIFDPLIFGRGRRIFPFPFRRYPTPIPFTFPWPSDERRRRVVASEPYRWLSCPGLLACSFVSSAGCKQRGVLRSIMLLTNEHIAGSIRFHNE